MTHDPDNRSRSMLPSLSFSWQVNLGHVLMMISMLTTGIVAYVDLRRSSIDQGQMLAALETRVDALSMRQSASDIAIATLGTRFGSIEELLREVRNELRESGQRENALPRR